MEWERTEQRYANDVRVRYDATIEMGTWDQIPNSLSELWVLVGKTLGELEARAWDVLMVELWVDHGSVLVYPLDSAKNSRLKTVTYELVINLINTEYMNTPDPDIDAQGFEDSHAQLVSRVDTAIRESMKRADVRETLLLLRQTHPFVIVCRDYDDKSTDRNIPYASLG